MRGRAGPPSPDTRLPRAEGVGKTLLEEGPLAVVDLHLRALSVFLVL